jgi:hypothetical protein
MSRSPRTRRGGGPDSLLMAVISRYMISSALLGIAASCAYGFLSTGAAPVESRWAYRAIYGAVGLGCTVGGAWLLLHRRTDG